MFIYIYICKYVCVYIYIHTHIHTHIVYIYHEGIGTNGLDQNSLRVDGKVAKLESAG